jgi:hypothetical protein
MTTKWDVMTHAQRQLILGDPSIDRNAQREEHDRSCAERWAANLPLSIDGIRRAKIYNRGKK